MPSSSPSGPSPPERGTNHGGTPDRGTPGSTASVSLTLTLSGGAALGAYEAGAAAAILESVHVLRQNGVNVTIDAVGGASAGALVAMFAAHAYVNDIDPVWMLREAWVERVSLALLKGRAFASPLGFGRLIDRVDELLDPKDEDGAPLHRREQPSADYPIGLHIALTGLRGLPYLVHGLGLLNPVKATTYADWGGFTLKPGGSVAAIREPPGSSILDFVLASAANPGVFAPRSLDRGPDEEGYYANGIEELPASRRLWYTDGGTLQVEPIGRVLTAARKARAAAGLPAPDNHVTLLVDPRSEMPSEGEAFSGDSQPSWVEGIARTLAIIPAQILYDDLRRVEKMNSRQSWAARLTDTLARHLDDDARADLADTLRELAAEQEGLRVGTEHDGGRSGDRESSDIRADSDATELLQRAFGLVGGLDGKHFAEADVISPLLLADDEEAQVTGLLAGEILGDFGGFLSKELRESDFLLGFDSTLAWLPTNLPRMGVSEELTKATVAAVRQREPQQWREANRGNADLRDLAWPARLQLVQLILRMGGVLAKDAMRSLRGR